MTFSDGSCDLNGRQPLGTFEVIHEGRSWILPLPTSVSAKVQVERGHFLCRSPSECISIHSSSIAQIPPRCDQRHSNRISGIGHLERYAFNDAFPLGYETLSTFRCGMGRKGHRLPHGGFEFLAGMLIACF